MASKDRPGQTGGGGQLDPWEELIVFLLGVWMVATVLTVATWHRLLDWLVEQGVLVPAAAAPLLEVPAGAGAGLDAPRLAILAAGLTFSVVLAATALRRRRRGEEPR